MKLIAKCSTEGCGLSIGYEIDGGQSICWFHAAKQKLPMHREWARAFAAWLCDTDLRPTATKRDNYGVMGRP